MPPISRLVLQVGLSCLSVIFIVSTVESVWPMPLRKYNGRPATGAPFCQAGVIPFCPTGLPSNTMPSVKDTDQLIVYAMKAPIWEFKFGDLLAKANLMHDAIGFHHVQSGLNLTMEWYELFQLFNCTFPHLPQPENITWCNQGATCIYSGIDAKHWRENGTLVQVAEINGTIFNKFAAWTETDNNTYPFYETWTVREKEANGKVWFNPFDCASWVIRAFEQMYSLGAEFNQSVHLNYTKISLLTSQEPVLIGNATTIYDDEHKEKLEALSLFYANFQHEKSYGEMLKHFAEYLTEFLVDGIFYLYYNEEYYELKLEEPYLALTYDETPLPGAKAKQT